MTEQIIEIDENGKVHGNNLEAAIASALNRFSAENGANGMNFQRCDPMTDQAVAAPRCACVSEDARRCLRLRHPFVADLEDEDDDSVDEWCECICHEWTAGDDQ